MSTTTQEFGTFARQQVLRTFVRNAAAWFVASLVGVLGFSAIQYLFFGEAGRDNALRTLTPPGFWPWFAWILVVYLVVSVFLVVMRVQFDATGIRARYASGLRKCCAWDDVRRIECLYSSETVIKSITFRFKDRTSIRLDANFADLWQMRGAIKHYSPAGIEICDVLPLPPMSSADSSFR